MTLICIRIRNQFPFEWLCTRTRFETEACSNSEMGYCHTGNSLITSNVTLTQSHYNRVVIVVFNRSQGFSPPTVGLAGKKHLTCLFKNLDDGRDSGLIKVNSHGFVSYLKRLH